MLQTWRWGFGLSCLRGWRLQPQGSWSAAAWVLCLSSSGGPCERASSGSALPAADSSPAVGGSAESPPKVSQAKNSVSTSLQHIHPFFSAYPYKDRGETGAYPSCYKGGRQSRHWTSRQCDTVLTHRGS